MSGYYSHHDFNSGMKPDTSNVSQQHLAMAYPDVGMMPASTSSSSSSSSDSSSSLSSSNTSLSSSPQAFIPFPGEAPPPTSVSVVMPSPVRYERQISGGDMDMQPLDLSVRQPREEPLPKRVRHVQNMSQADMKSFGLGVGGRGGSGATGRSGHRLSPYPMTGSGLSRSPNPMLQNHQLQQQQNHQVVRTDSPFYLQQRQTPSPAYYNSVNGALPSYYMPLRPPSVSESSPFQILASSNSVLNGLSSSNGSLFRPYDDHIESAMISENNGTLSTASTLPRPHSQPQEEEEPTYMDLDSTSPTKTVYSRGAMSNEFRPGQSDHISRGAGVCQKSISSGEITNGSGLVEGNNAMTTSPHNLDQRAEIGSHHQQLGAQSFSNSENQQLFCDSSDQANDTSTATTTTGNTVEMYVNGGDPSTSHGFATTGSIPRGQNVVRSPEAGIQEQQSPHPSHERGPLSRPYPTPSSTVVSHSFCPSVESNQHNHHPDSSSSSMSHHSTTNFSGLVSTAPNDQCPSSSSASSSCAPSISASDSGFTTSYMSESYSNPDISHHIDGKDAVASSPNNKENRSNATAPKQRQSFFVNNPSSFVEAKNKKNGEKKYRLSVPDESPSSQTKDGEPAGDENSTKISVLDFWISKVLMERVDAPPKPCGKASIQHKFIDGRNKIQVRLVDLIELQVEQSLKA